MKAKVYLPAFLLLIILNMLPPQTYAAMIGDPPAKERIENMTEAEQKVRLEEIEKRVKEIRSMDKSTLSRDERKALKKELKEMQREARAVRGIYLSIGAVIIIILLLILIL